MKIAIVSGYFDPFHVGHLEYLKLARLSADMLIVILNNDNQAALKKGYSFMNERDRLKIISEFRVVDRVILSLDVDTSVCNTLELIANQYNNDTLVFCNGGDRHVAEVPEMEVCTKYNIEMVDGLGEKIESSSELVNKKHENKIS